MNKGKVYLVGAGPGDPRLITIRGMQCIKECTAIVYDRLASPRLLRYARPDVKRVYVGKLPDRHTMKQEDINQLLVDLALEGHTVTRLKGGDPTIFGRVGEEAGLLRKHNIDFEIIPGITSAISVPAYAGIPVTHREHASSLSIITGHESPEKLDRSIYWDKVTNATGTLLFLMGVAKIDYISKQLMKHGRSADTPVALVRWGTTPEQQTLVGTLGTIAELVRTRKFESPAIIIVGDVVKQREALQWYERMPLFGMRILVTRARAQASDFAEMIEALGGEPCEFPVIEVRKPQESQYLQHIEACLKQAEGYDWLAFTSVNGVEYFFQYLIEHRVDIRKFYKARVAAVGPKTAEALEQRGIKVDLQASRYDAEGLLEAFEHVLQPGERVLLPRGDLARAVLPEQLRQQGIHADEISVYETVIAPLQEPIIIDWLKEKHIHMLTFTSSSTVKNLIKVLEQAGIEDPVALISQYPIASIGPITTATIESFGLKVTIEAEEATIESLTAALVGYNAAQRIEQEEK